MGRPEKHIIQRQVFELSTSSSKEGFECQQRASTYIQQIIYPQLEACFNFLQLGDKYLVIDKLEIDLGIFTKDSFEKEAAARLAGLLSSRLRAYMESASDNNKATYQHSRKDAAGNEVITESQEATVQVLTDAKVFHRVLYYFLQHGCLPWWFTPENKKPEETFSHTSIDLLQEEEKSSFKEILRISAVARMRLVNHFSATWLVRFLEAIGFAGTKAIQQWQILAPVIQSQPEVNARFHQYFWMAWIEAACHNRQTINITLLVEKTAGGYNDMAITMAQAIHRVCINTSSNSSHIIWSGYAEAIQKYLQHKMPYDEFRKQTINKATPITTEQDTSSEWLRNDRIDDDKASTPTLTERDNITEDDALFIPAAGLVILHPFLTELFTSLGLWTGTQWQTDNSVHKAIQLLSQLVYGRTDIPEYQAPFFKIMTGLDMEAPLPAQVPLTDEEFQSCTDLLQAVIGHWTALRNSSAEALQEGFLQRHGKLIKNKKGYHLTVERLAQDVLLSRLPWGYSMIKLPWMNDMLHVTWLQ